MRRKDDSSDIMNKIIKICFEIIVSALVVFFFFIILATLSEYLKFS